MTAQGEETSSEFPAPEDVPRLLDLIDDAQGRLERAVRAAGGRRPEDPVRLPGWTVGHVLTHLARHADAVSRVVAGASVGERPEQYVGGAEGRAAEIERGAARPLPELLTDLRTSAARCTLVLRGVPARTWLTRIDRGGRQEPVTRMLVSRWREIEIHHADLGPYGPRDWPEAFVTYHLPRELRHLPSRAPGVTVPPGLPDEDVLAWLVGRGAPGLPELPAWA